MAVCNTEQPRSENLVLKIPCELEFAPMYIIDPIANKSGSTHTISLTINQEKNLLFQFKHILQRSSVGYRKNVMAIPKEQCSLDYLLCSYIIHSTNSSGRTDRIEAWKRSRGSNQRITTYHRYEVKGFGSTPEDGIHNISWKKRTLTA